MEDITSHKVLITYSSGNKEIVDFLTNNINASVKMYSVARPKFTWNIIKQNPKLNPIDNYDSEFEVSEKHLLSKLYSCQDMMEILLDKGTKDPHYELISTLISRLETHIQNNQDLL